MKPLFGAITALVTPFVGGELDLQSFKKLIRSQLENSIDGVVVNGTTGESPTISNSEFTRLMETAQEAVSGKIPIIAGCGGNDTKKVCEKVKLAKKLGADFALSVTPYYNKPTQKGMISHFKAVAEEGDLPIILYNVPGRTGVSISAETVAELSRHPLIVGIKEASGDMGLGAEMKRLAKEDFIFLSGDDATSVSFCAVGGVGLISVTSNLFPKELHDLFSYFRAGDLAQALKLHLRLLPLHRVLFIESSPAPVKFALSLKGFMKNELRLPLVPVSDASERKIKETLEAFEKSN